MAADGDFAPSEAVPDAVAASPGVIPQTPGSETKRSSRTTNKPQSHAQTIVLHSVSPSQDRRSPTRSPSVSEKYTNHMRPVDQSDHEITEAVYEYLQTSAGEDVLSAFQNASEQPPVTFQSLEELDMPRIINNPKLRYDVNFDRELHFRPNLDGSKGKAKLKQADEYWKAMKGELIMCGLVHERQRTALVKGDEAPKSEAYWQGILSRSLKRLPKVFQTIRDVLRTLVPDSDQKAVSERLDVSLIMQEIQMGMCDLVDLANWLARVLKKHCAPMRDPMVDRMQKEIVQGATDQKPQRLVGGIKQLLNVLEAMKLDVANHQIRHMRPLLIEDTINFQRRYNAHRISLNKIDVRRSRLWLDCEMAHMTTECSIPSPLEAFVSASLRGLLSANYANNFPQTFYLDVDRLRALQTDLHTSIYFDICRDVLVDMVVSPDVSIADMNKGMQALHMTLTAFISPTPGSPSDFARNSCPLPERVENIAAEIMRLVLLLERREVIFDAELLDAIEQRLETGLQPNSIAFEKYADDLLDALLPRLQAVVDQHVRLPAIQLHDKFVPLLNIPPQTPAPVSWAYGAVCAPAQAVAPPLAPNVPSNPDDDLLTRRLTHLIVLHWQIWSDLVYLMDDSEDGSDSEWGSIATGGRSSPASIAEGASPTVPVAQAVYAPGKKWLPIALKVEEMVPTSSMAPSATATASKPKADEDENRSADQVHEAAETEKKEGNSESLPEQSERDPTQRQSTCG